MSNNLDKKLKELKQKKVQLRDKERKLEIKHEQEELDCSEYLKQYKEVSKEINQVRDKIADTKIEKIEKKQKRMGVDLSKPLEKRFPRIFGD